MQLSRVTSAPRQVGSEAYRVDVGCLRRTAVLVAAVLGQAACTHEYVVDRRAWEQTRALGEEQRRAADRVAAREGTRNVFLEADFVATVPPSIEGDHVRLRERRWPARAIGGVLLGVGIASALAAAFVLFADNSVCFGSSCSTRIGAMPLVAILAGLVVAGVGGAFFALPSRSTAGDSAHAPAAASGTLIDSACWSVRDALQTLRGAITACDVHEFVARLELDGALAEVTLENRRGFQLPGAGECIGQALAPLRSMRLSRGRVTCRVDLATLQPLPVLAPSAP